MMAPLMSHRRERGSAMALIVIVSVIITGMIVTMSWAAGMGARNADDLKQLDKAFYVAEAGVQRVAWYVKNNKLSSITSPMTGSIGSNTYTTSWTTVSTSTIHVTSVGVHNGATYTLSENITAPVPAAAVIATGGDLAGKNITIVGDVLTGGSIDEGPGVGSINGNLTYYGTATGVDSSNVSGTISAMTGTYAGIDLDAMGDTLIAAAGKTYTGDQNGKTFDFTALSGTNKVIYVNGNVTDPTFIGAGTLYVKGSVSVGDFGTSSNPVNIVATGDITLANNATVYGSIYTAGDWYRGKFTMTGLVYVKGVDKSNNGHSYLTMTTVPWFDPRPGGTWGGGSGTGATSFTSFAGPNP